MKKARSQKGSLCLSVNGSGTEVWIFRWWETSTDGRRVRRKRQVGTLDQYKTEEAAERAVRNWRLVLRANQDGAASGITMRALIGHFREKELVDKGEDGRAWSTRDRYEAYLNSWIEPRWGKEELTAIRAPWSRSGCVTSGRNRASGSGLNWSRPGGNRSRWHLPARPRSGI